MIENQIGFSYKLPNNKSLYIVSSRPLTEEEQDVGHDEKIFGVCYLLCIGKEICGVSFSTQSQAMCAAVGAQWGAYNADICSL